MNPLKDAREAYEAVAIPERLADTVKNAVREGRRAAREERAGRWRRGAVYAAACMALTFIVALNTIPVFAKSLGEVPVIGNMARVFTFREYKEEDELELVEVRMPALKGTSNTSLERRINVEIYTKMSRELEDAKARAAEFRQMILDNGGTIEQFLPFEITMDYEIKCQNDEILSFIISKSESGGWFYLEQYFYNIDLHTGQELTLRHLLGSNYMELVNEQVLEQIKERSADPDLMYYEGEEAFNSIGADQDFYVNEEGHVVVVFEKYEIAPGFMGIQEFEILP